MRILYVEDNPRDADLTVRVLRKTAPQLHLETVSTIREAIARLDRIASDQLDLVLTDMQLRDGDGLSLLQYIREHSLPLAVVVVTGMGDEETAVAVLKSRADDYIVKHENYLQRLPDILESALNHYRADAARRARPLNILYAEDEPRDVDITRRFFAMHADHLHLDVVSNGPEVLSALQLRTGGPRYDVLLMNFDLYELNALEVLRDLRLNRQQGVPVVLLCRECDEEVGRQALKLGASSYLVKRPGYLYQLPWELEEAHFRAELMRREKALRESEAKLASELADAKLLQKISSQLQLEDNIEELYGQILDAVIVLLKSDAGSMQMLDEVRNELGLLAYRGFDPESAKLWERLGADAQSVCAEAKRSNRRVIVPDVETCDFLAGTETLKGLLRSGLRAVQSTPLISRNGRMVGMISTHWRQAHEPSERELRLLDVVARQAADLIERKQAEEALRESEERNRAILNAIPDLMLLQSRDGTFLDYHAKEPDMLLVPPEQFLGKKMQEVLPRAVASDIAASFEQALGSDKPVLLEYTLPMPQGTRAFEASIVSCDDDKFLSIVRDITERKEADESLRRALDEVRQLKDRLHEENIYLQEEIRDASNFGEIIGSSEALGQVLRQAQQVAPMDTTVLILGETGTGKELLAHAIHNLSARNKHPLVKVSCAALPAPLIESELFGHEKGAFTGASAQRRGRFELADGGTIFLDEVGELPLELQAKLLRALEHGEFERVGGSRTLRVDVRVIAATNRDLAEAKEKGTFRPDLYYRLSVYPLTLPPLRERREDIPALVTHLVKQLSTKMGKEIETVPQSAMAALQDYHWPGNIRELRNVIERAVIITPGAKLQLSDSAEAQQPPGAATHLPGVPFDSQLDESPLAETLIEHEYNLILRTLKRVNWKVEGPDGAAQLLDINPSTLRTRMKKLGITRI